MEHRSFPLTDPYPSPRAVFPAHIPFAPSPQFEHLEQTMVTNPVSACASAIGSRA